VGWKRFLGLKKALWCAGAAFALVLATLAGTSVTAGAASTAGGAAGTSVTVESAGAPGAGEVAGVGRSARPCNIYASGGTPCVAAYSTTRALYQSYNGPLYRVTRASDGTTKNVGTSQAGGYANAAAQNSFCAGTVCTITRIFDQSPYRNDLGVGPIGGNGGADAAAIANAVEELLRYLSIVHAQVDRIATEDLILGGQQIRTGDRLLMNLPAGNWDSEFVDSPETLDIARNARGHVAFGYGTHQCLGANLARVEMQVAFATLARRLPGLQLAVPPAELKFKDADIYGMKELPVKW